MNLIGITRRIEITFWTLAVRVMKEPKLLRLVLFAFVLSMSLIFGGLFFATFKHATADRQSNQTEQGTLAAAAPVIPTETITSGAAKNQRKVLVAVVDNLQVERPMLETVWLATYVDARNQLSMLPLFPRINSDGWSEDTFVDERLALDATRKFPAALQELFRSEQIGWDNYLFLDDYGLAMLIDITGGVDFGRGQVSGVRALAQLPLAREDSQAAMYAYATLIRSICRRSADLVENTEVVNIYQQLGSHLYTDMPEQLFVDEWQRLGNEKSGVFCDFPSLQHLSPFTQK